MKKVFTFFGVALLMVLLVACKKTPKVEEYSVTFDLNYQGAPAAEVVKVKKGEVVAAPEEDPAREGYEFAGWYLEAEAYDFEAEVKEDLVLKAKWLQLFTVTFDAGEGESPEAQVVGEGLTATKPAAPKLEGYQFDSWLLDGEEYDFTAPVTSNITLVAKWLELVSVTFDLDYEGAPKAEVAKVVKGKAVASPDDPAREGYRFDGWLLDGEKYDFETPVTADTVLKAKWLELRKVTYLLEEDEDPAHAVREFVLGGPVEKIGDPAKRGYKFLGWLLDGEAYDLETPANDDITLVASWLALAEVTVTFDLNYEGSEPIEVLMYEGETVLVPAIPGRDGHYLTGWELDGEAFSLDTVLTESITLVAVWVEAGEGQVVIFEDHRLGNLTVVPVVNGEVSAPADPVRAGFRFGGWYKTKAGKVWNEVEPQKFPLTVAPEVEEVLLYAYWEPINSKTMNWSANETYVSTMVRPDRIIINPLEYRWSHEDDFIDMLVAPMYTTEIDWGHAMAEGFADYPGDFSYIERGEFSIEAFDYKYILAGAAKYPVNENGETAVIDGEYDRDLASEITGKEWTFEIRKDLVFEDGTPIDARTFEFTLKQWLDGDQNAYRANMWYKNPTNSNGRPILNTEQYFKGEVTWDEVGFKLGEADENGNIYTFKVITWEDIRLADAVGIANDIRLIHPEKYLASMDPASGLSQYGTPAHPFVSYGGYILKEWDANARMVFNKNFDYVLRETINYKSQVIEIVADTAEAYNLFKKGNTSVLGLTKDYYAEYAEDPNVKDSWGGYPQYMIINQATSKLSGAQRHEHPSILSDARFRQALLYGFNRKEFAYNVYAPNKPASSPIPENAVHYQFDPLFYTESAQHREVIEELGFELDDYLFGPEKAKALFEAAYTDWLAEGNTGPVTLRYITGNDAFSVSLDDYIKESLEKLFEDENGNKRLIISINQYDGTGLQNQIKNHNFDLTLTALGFGHAVNAYWQYAAIALLPAEIGAEGFGLFYPNVEGPDGKNVKAEYIDWEIEVDFGNTFAHLSAQDPEEMNPNHKAFLEMLDEDGFFRGTVYDIADYILSTPTVFTAAPNQPFEGAREDLNNLTAEFERVFFKYVPVIPTVTRSNSTIYADNVHIEWPQYSNTFGWGAARYRYLITDPDFADRA